MSQLALDVWAARKILTVKWKTIHFFQRRDGDQSNESNTITTENQHQWIAFVKDESGQVLKVKCKSDHYESKGIGDTLLFKEFRGEIFKVEYFSHNDEDLDSLDVKKNHLR